MFDWEFIRANIPLYREALVLTIRLALFGILGAFVLGLLISLIKYYKIPVSSQIRQVYAKLSRNTPLLIQLHSLHFGLPKVGIVLSLEMCAAVGLIFLGGPYMVESFRSGLEVISKTQYEVGLSTGLKPVQNLLYVTFLQALAVSLPSLAANAVFLIKETSVFSIVALADLMYVAKDLIGSYYEADEVLSMLVLAYLIILLPISLVTRLIERRSRHVGFGATSALSGK